jgi:hypothetical protein
MRTETLQCQQLSIMIRGGSITKDISRMTNAHMRLFQTIEVAAAIAMGTLLVTHPRPQQPEDGLGGMSAQQVLNCAKDEKCKLHDDRFELAQALSGRQNIPLLIGAYEGASSYQGEVIVIGLFRLRDPRVEAFMRRIAFSNLKPHEPDYDPYWYPLQYLARGCDERALARLSRPENIMKAYPIGCMWWQDTVKAFGDCNYRPAIPYLIEALSTACINIDENAAKALKKLLPGTCENKKWPEAMQQCYRQAARKRGYKMLR